MKNRQTNTRIEFHILQSFPVSCLNRDDVGAPKTAVVGGVTRARISSQCWKRQVRLAMQDFGIKLAKRTKLVAPMFAKACVDLGADVKEAEACGEKMAGFLVKDTLLFISDSEVKVFAEYAREQGFDIEKLKEKNVLRASKGAIDPAVDALDIALFGRMVAKVTDMNVEAASAFSHAISTHKVMNEVEFFTAVDDDPNAAQGSAHMGSLEFNSATYYRYVSLDLGQLTTLIPDDECRRTAVSAFTKALYLAVPSARQSTQSGASPWEFARILVRSGQRLQVPFEAPVKARGSGYLAPSIEFLKTYLDKKQKLSGSLYGLIESYEYGDDANFSIDDLINGLEIHA